MNRRLISSIFLTNLPILFLYAQSLTGVWNGTINIGQTSLPLVFHISSQNGKNICTIDSPDQGAKNIPTTITYLDADSICLQIQQIGASYRGKLHNNQIKGFFSQSGMQFQLNLKSGDFIRERKQTPKAPLLYPTEEVTFENPSDHAQLSGTLSYPITYAISKDIPVVLLVTGSGQQNRDEEIMGHKPFAVIADYLAKMGIASLRYDDRGFGKSTGNLNDATSHTFMTDALAGINYLKSKGKFSKIGILGHSEGGMIAFMAAVEAPNDIDFIVSLAGTAVKGSEILLKQNEILLSATPQTAIYSKDYCKVLDKILQLQSESTKTYNDEEAKAIVGQYATQVGAKLPEPALQNLQKVLLTSNPWFKYFIAYDPTDAISKTTCPVMAINGDKDTQVDAVLNLETLRKTLPENKKHLIKSYIGLNHLFQHCDTGHIYEYAKIEETISPEVLSDIAEFILNL